jgi:hypothetical protein
MASTSSSRDTTWFARIASTVNSARWRADPSASSVDPRQARTAPSSWTRSGSADSVDISAAPGSQRVRIPTRAPPVPEVHFTGRNAENPCVKKATTLMNDGSAVSATAPPSAS